METSHGIAADARLVLVVDDEPLLRMSTCDILEDAEIHTIEAATADEAITALEAYPGIDVVFTDIQMPGSVDGVELARIVATRWPHKTVVVSSGHPRPSDKPLPSRILMLPKPFNPAALVPIINVTRAR